MWHWEKQSFKTSNLRMCPFGISLSLGKQTSLAPKDLSSQTQVLSWPCPNIFRIAIQIKSILKEISPEYSLGRLMLKLKLQYSGPWCEEMTHWKRSWQWERLKAREGDNRGWDGWMASLTVWTWVWVSSGSWWCIGNHGVLQSMGWQRVRHDWATELNWFPTYSFINLNEGAIGEWIYF